MRTLRCVATTLLLLTASFAVAQSNPIIPPEQLMASLEESAAIAERTLDVRRAFPDEITAEQFVRDMADLQEQFEPILSLIIETDPPREMQQLAMLTAMGAKGVELSLWHYIYALLTSDSRYLELGDSYLSAGLDHLRSAVMMSERFR